MTPRHAPRPPLLPTILAAALLAGQVSACKTDLSTTPPSPPRSGIDGAAPSAESSPVITHAAYPVSPATASTGRTTAVPPTPASAPAVDMAAPARAPGVKTFIDCYDVIPGIPACSGIEPLASGRIAFVAQRSPDHYPDMARIAQLDGDGLWYPKSEGRLDTPVWSPSGQYLAWQHWLPFEPQMQVHEPEGPVLTDREGRPVPAIEDVMLDAARPRFLSSEQTPDGAEAFVVHDGRSLIALSLPEGDRRPMPVPPGWVREFDWLLTRSGGLVALHFDATHEQPNPPQYLTIQERWWEDGIERIERTAETLLPNLNLFGQSPDGRWLLASDVGHILSNSQARYVPFVRIDPQSGAEQALPIRSSELGVVNARGAYRRPWHPAGINTLLLAGMPLDGLKDGGYDQVEISRLAAIDLDTGTVRWLTDDTLRAASPAWSPDGRLVAFAALDASRELVGDWPMLSNQDVYDTRRGMALYLLDVDTGEVHRITEPGEAWDSGPEWSADGSRLLYMRGFDPTAEEDTGPSRYQVRVWMLADERDSLILDHVGKDWAWWEEGRAGP